MPNNFGFGLCIFRSRPKQRAGKKSVWKRSTLISGCVIFYTFKYFIGNQYPRKTTLIFIPDESSLPSEEQRNQPQSVEIKSIGSRPLIGWQWSRDLDTGLWLVLMCKTLYAGLHPEHWGYCPVLRCLTLGPCDIWVPDILMPRSRVMEEMGNVE